MPPDAGGRESVPTPAFFDTRTHTLTYTMTKLTDTVDERNHPRTMSVAMRETARTNGDGTIEVDDDEHVATLKRAGFEVVNDDPTEGEDGEADDASEDGGDETDPDSEPDAGKLPVEEWDLTKPLEEHDHGELKEIAEDLGIADDIDLRSKASIREGIEENSHFGDE